jgi:ArsR family transcriptional regulator, arsenate/arsenite/antimonite-responsive transcriptional repressor
VDVSTALEPIRIEVADRLGALTDPARLRIVGILASGGRCVCDLRVEMVIAANLLSYHLRVLRDAGVPRPGDAIDERTSGRLCELDGVAT